MIRSGALEGLTLRKVPEIQEGDYLRAQALLARSREIYDTVERYREEGYRVILPEDEEWPVRLSALGAQMPQFLFARGDLSVLKACCVSVAGSRIIRENTLDAALRLGKEIAKQGYSLVCGGARGVDTAVQRACLEAGGNLILVPAYPCDQLLRQEYLRNALNKGKVLLLCDTWPCEAFSAGKALARNNTIYALGNAAVSVASRKGKGGTWRGAVDCLRGGYTPLFVLNEHDAASEGNRALLSLGAKELDLSCSISQQMFPEGGVDK